MKRPLGVTILAYFYFSGAVIFLIVLILNRIQPSWLNRLTNPNLQEDIEHAGKFAGVHVLLILIFVAFGVGFWKMQRWARYTVMVIMAADLARRVLGFGLYELLRSMDASRPVHTPGTFFWFAGTINAAMFLYLRMTHVREAFNKRTA